MKHINLINKKNLIFLFIVTFNVFVFQSCKNEDRPSEEKMSECLADELQNKAKILSYKLQDGLTKEKDGVKYYDGYFNAEVKFIANYNEYVAGDQYKIIKGAISFIKTDNGWNCWKNQLN